MRKQIILLLIMKSLLSEWPVLTQKMFYCFVNQFTSLDLALGAII